MDNKNHQGHMRLGRRQSGVAAPVVVASLVAVMAMAGLSIDVGYIVWNQKRLNTAVDSAALAGAQDLWSKGWDTDVQATVQRYAARYSPSGGGGNPDSTNTLAISPDKVDAPTATCLRLGSVDLDYTRATSTCNAIRVRQTARVPLIFLPVVGIREKTIAATATASAGGGGSPPLNVAMVLDTTASMSSNMVSCSPYGTLTRLNCAKKGMQDLVKKLKARGNTVGLTVFPPRNSAAAVAKDVDCSSNLGGSDLSKYMAGSDGAYPWRDSTNSISTIIGWASSADYIANNDLNTNHNLVKAIGGRSSCVGAEAPGGVGTYYAQAIRQAQYTFASMNNGQDSIMVVLSDGDADGDIQPEALVRGTIYDGEDASFSATIYGATTSVSGTTMRVASVSSGTIAIGETVSGSGITSGTRIVSQLSGTTGGVGNYQVSVSHRLTTNRTVTTSRRSGTTLRVSSVTSGTLAVGKTIGGSGITAGTTITAMASTTGCINAYNQCTGTGGTGTYRVSNAHNRASTQDITVPSGYEEKQCQQAVLATNDARTAGTKVYVIAYGASTSSGCSTDSSVLSPLNDRGIRTRPCNTLQWMAGDSTGITTTRPTTQSRYFYSTDASCTTVSGNTASSVADIFEDIGYGLLGSRLIPDDAQ
jgi:Flp pilus assembly protein TadG